MPDKTGNGRIYFLEERMLRGKHDMLIISWRDPNDRYKAHTIYNIDNERICRSIKTDIPIVNKRDTICNINIFAGKDVGGTKKMFDRFNYLFNTEFPESFTAYDNKLGLSKSTICEIERAFTNHIYESPYLEKVAADACVPAIDVCGGYFFGDLVLKAAKLKNDYCSRVISKNPYIAGRIT